MLWTLNVDQGTFYVYNCGWQNKHSSEATNVLGYIDKRHNVMRRADKRQCTPWVTLSVHVCVNDNVMMMPSLLKTLARMKHSILFRLHM